MNPKKTLNLFLATVTTALLATSCTPKVANTNKYFDENIDNTTFYNVEGWEKLSSDDEIYKNIIGTKDESISKMVSIDFRKSSFHLDKSETRYGSGKSTHYFYLDGTKSEDKGVTKYVNEDGSVEKTENTYISEESVNGEDRFFDKRYNSAVKPELTWSIGKIKNHTEEFYNLNFTFGVEDELYYTVDESKNTIVSRTEVYYNFVQGGGSALVNELTRQFIFVFDRNYFLKERYSYSEQVYETERDIEHNRSVICANIKYGTVKGYPNKDEFIESVPDEYLFSAINYFDVFQIVDGNINYSSYNRHRMYVEPTRDYDKGTISEVLQEEVVAENNPIAILFFVEKSYYVLKESLSNYFKHAKQYITDKVAELYNYETVNYEYGDNVLMVIPQGETFVVDLISESSLYDSSVTNVRKS